MQQSQSDATAFAQPSLDPDELKDRVAAAIERLDDPMYLLRRAYRLLKERGYEESALPMLPLRRAYRLLGSEEARHAS